MCGVVGFLYKKAPAGPLGHTILAMLDVLGSRGVDGTGVAFYGPDTGRDLIARVRLGGAEPAEVQATRVQRRLSAMAQVTGAVVQHDFLRLTLHDGGDVAAIADTIERNDPGVEVFSVGRQMEIVKQVGPAQTLRGRYGLDNFHGTHGIGHTRLATESRVDVAHCHPFWARPFSDIAVVHNGQITNYHKMRRILEMRGYHFATENDSEFIALYIAHAMKAGATLEEAMRSSLRDLDGTFTYLVSTPDGIGLVRDGFATKPMVVTENDDWVALSSEETAICQAIPGPCEVRQPGARTVQVWRRSGIRELAAARA